MEWQSADAGLPVDVRYSVVGCSVTCRLIVIRCGLFVPLSHRLDLGAQRNHCPFLAW